MIRRMAPVDVDAPVISNVRLSAGYSVLTIAAPEIGRRSAPGQFVMVKPDRGTDPLLRRPFSVFEILRDADGAPTAISILNKHAGPTTRILYEAYPGSRIHCLGPLGKPFTTTVVPREAWMVAGGVGLAPFATLAEALVTAGTRTTLFYGARSDDELFYLDFFQRLGVRLVLATEDGSLGVKGRVTLPLDEALGRLSGPNAVQVYACGPEPMLAEVHRLSARHHQACEVSVERVMGCGLGGCYSCVVSVRDGDGPAHHVRSCLSGPVFDGSSVVWD